LHVHIRYLCVSIHKCTQMSLFSSFYNTFRKKLWNWHFIAIGTYFIIIFHKIFLLSSSIFLHIINTFLILYISTWKNTLHALSQIKIVVFRNIGRGTYSELI